MNYFINILKYIRSLSSSSWGLGFVIAFEKFVRLLLYPLKYCNNGKSINFFLLGFDYCISIDGGKFFIRNGTDDEFIISPLFEGELNNLFSMKGGVFLDIGSHIGKYTIKIARESKENRVIAFEANSQTYKSLMINTIINDLDNVKVENIAIGEKDGELVFLEGKRNTGVSRIVRDQGKELIHMGAVSQDDIIIKDVKMTYIDKYLMQNNIDYASIKLIKIDVEGNEFPVLLGMKDLLSVNKKIKLIVEITESLDDIISYMNTLGYGSIRISETYFVFNSKKK